MDYNFNSIKTNFYFNFFMKHINLPDSLINLNQRLGQSFETKIINLKLFQVIRTAKITTI